MSRVVYLHGFASSPASKKAIFFEQRFTELAWRVEVPDLAAGDFEHLTISGQLRVIEAACGLEPAVLMGSSMGGYLAALYAARHPEVRKVILMAPAFCFGRIFPSMFAPEQTAEWRSQGSMPVLHYGEGRERNLSYQIMEDAAAYEDYPGFGQPALIFHGVHDTVVPAGLSEEFAATRPNVRLRLLDSDHELANVFELMWGETLEFLSA